MSKSGKPKETDIVSYAIQGAKPKGRYHIRSQTNDGTNIVRKQKWNNRYP